MTGRHSPKYSRESKSKRLAVFKLIHFCLSVILFYFFFLFFRYGRLTDISKIGFRYNYYAALCYGALLLFFTRTYNAYLLGYKRIRSLAFGQFLSQFLSLILMVVIVTISWNHYHKPWIFLLLLFLQSVLDAGWSYFANGYFFKLNPRRKTLLVYRNDLDKRRFGTIHGKPLERLYIITDELRYDGSFVDLEEQLAGYDAIFAAGVNSRCRNGILKYCIENRVHGFFLPHVGDTIMRDANHIQSFDSPVLYINRKELSPEYVAAKRAFDIISSLFGIVLLSPVMLITALAIHLYDGGPALYKQTRLTKDGKEFRILKFRSMRVDAEKDGVARLSSGENDNRITPVGRIVRKCRIDELPQLFNILKGEMSVVGPRPERPEIAEEYYKTIPDFRLRLQVKAGLTGYAQVYGKYNTDPYEKLEFDLLYINQMNFFTDLQLCFATFAVLFSKDSTQGYSGEDGVAVGENFFMNGFERPEMVDYEKESGDNSFENS